MNHSQVSNIKLKQFKNYKNLHISLNYYSTISPSFTFSKLRVSFQIHHYNNLSIHELQTCCNDVLLY